MYGMFVSIAHQCALDDQPYVQVYKEIDCRKSTQFRVYKQTDCHDLYITNKYNKYILARYEDVLEE